ncbi:protoporphyrinogen oxidase-like isoform X3 [Varroa jacobsoni]|uniref:Protoporphyrinogen oxidase n=1 Tax=Varroa destructor TaxID=109461 RepID=A0A7M7K2P7_VARDE|nr:protoporphyrinogen oxidase-like isoform X3 [Varroa destructor]XP_022686577.1 protoporphyrinogen oxidase-like isoform X3 [Varroa jacobsoni]
MGWDSGEIMQSAVVLGGGISGLAATYYLTRIPDIQRIILVDKKARLGGWIQSTRYPCGTVDEHGPHSIRVDGVQGANTLNLIEELKLGDEILPVSPTALRGRMIYHEGKLLWLPKGLGDIFRIRKPFSKPLVFPILKELVKPKSDIEDESLYSFVQRRFNDEMAKYIIDPMCRGICAGDAKEISVRSLLPAMYNAEKKHGSVIKGMLKNSNMGAVSGLAQKAHKEHWGAFSFRQGLQTLVDRLVEVVAEDRRVTIYENEDNVHLSEEDGRFTVEYAEGRTQAHHLFSCIPAKALSRLMSRVEPRMSSALLEIPLVHLVSCTLEFKGSLLPHQAFGYLVPSSEGSRVLGMIFDTACFPRHDGQYYKKTRVTCLMGGRWFATNFGDVKSVQATTFTETATDACREHLGLTQKPIRHLTNILPNCIPQYQVGHYATVMKLKNLIAENNFQMSLLGSSYEGLSVNDCIYNAKLTVEKYAKSQGII